MEDKKVLLSVNDLEVKFHVRGRILTAIRGISLDIFENESIAIVGESGSGKSVFTKTFAGMLDSNGFISRGDIIFNDEELIETNAAYGKKEKEIVEKLRAELDLGAGLEAGADTWKKITSLENAHKLRFSLSEEEEEQFEKQAEYIRYAASEAYNYKLTLDSSKEKQLIHETEAKIAEYKKQLKEIERKRRQRISEHRSAAAADSEAQTRYTAEKTRLESLYAGQIKTPVTGAQSERNLIIAKEIHLSTARIGGLRASRMRRALLKECLNAMKTGVDMYDPEERNRVFDPVIFRVRYIDETEDRLHGQCVLNLAKIKEQGDWTQIRGSKIATVFQDPMTSLNPIITIGQQIMSVILKHQDCTEVEARERALTLMKKVGIPNAEQRFDDYPFQYSGGMRQRIVIAIALSCQPKILICDEPTTALDVTIQAQILRLLKKLQSEFGYTIVFITHDLGVVANIADRVAVLYAGQIVELGNVDEVFFDPRHPYTWALMSSMPQLAERNTVLYSITGTPPSLYNKIVGDPFAPRNPYCLKLDTLKEPPMFKVSETHYAKTWLLDPRAPKVEKPETIRNIHEKLIKAFNIGGEQNV